MVTSGVSTWAVASSAARNSAFLDEATTGFDPEARRQFWDPIRSLRAPVADVLTPRELVVLRLVGIGLTNAKIGSRLFIGESTVKTHLLRTFAKLGVDDRTAAATMAMRRGLLTES